ncbi:hypothetical protein JCM30237_13050 [Halolamina litorea]|uniref:hypothetical protein n=1 Tax=Halolamina litorea TaxID=1515593 RepID=UPI0022706F61|nr:hypothetical protein [Halolamina litorea]
MNSLRRAYRWIKGRGQSGSRSGFAVRVGFVSALAVLAFGALTNESTITDAVVMGTLMAAAYYFFDPQDTG